MGSGDSRFLVLALGILVVAGFYSGFLGSSMTGQQVRVPDCIRSESQIPLGGDGKTIMAHTLNFCGTITLTQEYIVAMNNLKIMCTPNTKLLYGGRGPAQFSAFRISGDVRGTLVKGCFFEGPFDAAIVNGGVDTRVQSTIITLANIGIYETDSAKNGLYETITAHQNKGIGLLLEGSDAVVQNSRISHNAIGVKTGKPPLQVPRAGRICSQTGIPATTCSDPSSGSNVQLLNNRITNNDGDGVQVFGIFNTLEQNIITANGGNGVEVVGAYVGSFNTQGFLEDMHLSGVTIKDNEITHNALNGFSLDRARGATQGGRPPAQYHAVTLVDNNLIDYNGDNGGIIDCAVQPYMGDWNEETHIDSNSLSSNKGNGLFVRCGSVFKTIFVTTNTINENTRNGVLLGDPVPGFFTFGILNALYDNDIKRNKENGVYVRNGQIDRTVLNEIDGNEQVGFLMGPSEAGETFFAHTIDCNSLSHNKEQGFYLNSQGVFRPYVSETAQLVTKFHRNFVVGNGISNGGNGATFLMGPLPPGYNPIPYIPFIGQSIYLNHFENNNGYGLSFKGAFGAGIFANNFLPNVLGLVEDTGSNTYENMWDEPQFSIGYPSHPGFPCGAAPGNCGNYFAPGVPPVYEVNVNKPPLTHCTTNPECLFRNCYTAKNVCGDRDEITSPTTFSGYYTPETSATCSLSIGVSSPPAPFCGDGAIDPGEECDPAAVPTGCPEGQTCNTNCKCEEEKIKTKEPEPGDPPITPPSAEEGII